MTPNLVGPMRPPVLRDPQLDARLDEDGYVVVDFAGPDLQAELRAIHDELDSGIGEGYYATMHSPDGAYKEAAHRAITRCFWPVLAPLLADHEPLVGAFVVKHPGEDTAVPPHQDWIVTDEGDHCSVNCWFPTARVNEVAGPIRVLPGSHRYLRALRGSPAFPTEIDGIGPRVFDELMETVAIEDGQAIVYDNRLLHGTAPNRSGHLRVVAYMAAIPRGARRLHYLRHPDGRVEGFEVDEAFFRSFQIGEVPAGARFLELDHYEIEPFSFEDLAARHRQSTGTLDR